MGDNNFKPTHVKNSLVKSFMVAVVALTTQVCTYNDLVYHAPIPSFDCSRCKYVVQANDETIDGKLLHLQGGDFICISATISRNLHLRLINIIGYPGNPVTIINCGGLVEHHVDIADVFNLKFERSRNFRVTGFGTDDSYGLILSGGTIGLSLDNLSTDFEVDNIEVHDTGFAGIMAKTDPSCDSATIRGNFVLRNSIFHDNYVHNVGGEGFYVGNSFYTSGVKLPCGIRFPHELQDISIHHNYVKNTGREAIQLGCTVGGAKIYNNVAEQYGLANLPGQMNGIQVGEGTGGLCFGNVINSGTGTGIIVLGLGDNVVFNNLIVNAGGAGIFCDNRFTPKDGFKFINNTIVSPLGDGIRLYADSSYLRNVVVNNVIANPGTYQLYHSGSDTLRTGKDAFLYLKDSTVHVYQSNNLFSLKVEDVNFIDPSTINFNLKRKSKAIDAGRDVSSFGVSYDFCGDFRPFGKNFDIGAFEYDSLLNLNTFQPCGVVSRPKTH